jgi:DNA-directed RNA polymerase specialized sigma24 family protein
VNEKQRQAREEANDLFQNFLNCRQEEEDHLLSTLMTAHAQPLIDEIIRFKLPVAQRFRADAEDLRNDILVQLLARLRQMRSDPSTNPIRNFRDYVAVVSYNACSQYFRKKYPQREALKNRLRYILRHDPNFAMWSHEEEWIHALPSNSTRSDPKHLHIETKAMH